MTKRQTFAALLLLGPALVARASFDGMASAGYRSPFSVQDSGADTQSSATFEGRSSLGVSAQGPAVASTAFSLYPGYLQRLPVPDSTATPTRSATATPSRSATPSPTASPTRTATSSPTASPTGTATPSSTASPTCTATASSTASPSLTPTLSATATATGTPFADLQLVKQAFPAFVTLPGDPITFVLTLQNNGSLAATGVTVWDSVPANSSYLSGSSGAAYAGGLLSWSLGALAPSASASFSFTASFTGVGTQVDNRGSADAANHAEVDSNTVHVGLAQPLTATRTPSSTPSPTISPSSTATPTDSHSPTPTESPTATATTTRTPTATASGSSTGTATATASATETGTPSGTETPSPTDTVSASPSFSATVSASSTATGSPSDTPSPTLSFSASPTATATPSATPTPLAPGLTLAKSAAETVAFHNSLIHYSLVVSNTGPGAAEGIQIYDTLPDGTNFSGPGSVQEDSYASNDAWRFTDGLALARGPFDLAAGQSFTVNLVVKVAFSSPGQNLSNTAQAVDAFFGQAAFGSAVVPMQAGEASPTASPTPSPVISASPTPFQTPVPPPLSLSFVRDQGQPWIGGTDLRFSMNVVNNTGAGVNDLVLGFNSDLEHQNQFLDFVEPNTLLGPSDPISPVAWRLYSGGIDTGVDMGTLSVAAGASLASPRRIFTTVMGGQGGTITSQVVLSSASLGLAVTATVEVYISDGPPSTPAALVQPSSTPSPVAGLGRIVAYPQPASDHLCFAFHAPAGGELRIQVYNAAFQLAAEFKSSATGFTQEDTCADIRGLAPGVYFYRAEVAGFAFPTGQFGIAR